MPLLSHVGTFTAPTSNGLLDVTGAGFEPKAVIIIGVGGSGSSTSFARHAFGVAASPTQQFVNVVRSADDGGTRRAHSGDHCVAVLGSSGWISRASFSTFLADGFQLNFDTTTSGTRIFSYLALGGDGLENAFVGHQQFNFDNASASVTGVGFEPNLIVMPGSTGSFNATDERQNITASIGAAMSGAIQFSAGISRSNGSNQASHAVLSDSTMALRLGLSTGSTFESVALTGFDADGFSVSLGGTSTGFARYGFLCLRIPNVQIGTFEQPSSTGTQGITGVGFEPQALLTFTRHKTSAAGVEPALLGAGLADSSGNNHSTTYHLESNGNNVLERRNSARFVDTATSDGAATTHAIAELQSLDSDGFTLDWTTVNDSISREHVYVAMAGGDAGDPDPGDPETFGPYKASDFNLGDKLHEVLPFTVQPGGDDTTSYWEVAERDGRRVWRWSGSGTDIFNLDDAGGAVEDAEILMSAIHADGGGSAGDTRVYGAFRDNTTSSVLDYYRCGQRNFSAGDDHRPRIEKWVNDSFSVLDDGDGLSSLAADTWARVRGGVSGTSLFAKYWLEGADESTAQEATATDSDLTSGRIGIAPGTSTSHIYDVEWFSFGINGATAPEPEVTSVTVTIPAIDMNSDPIPDQSGVSAWVWSDRSEAAVVKTDLEIADGELVIDVEGDGFTDQEEVVVMAELSGGNIATARGTVVGS